MARAFTDMCSWVLPVDWSSFRISAGDVPAAAAPPLQGLGAAHQALLQGGGPTGFQPYKRPENFCVKVSHLQAKQGWSTFL